MIEIRLDRATQRQLRRLRILDPQTVALATAQALNRTRNNAQTAGIKAVSLAMGIPRSKLKKRGRAIVTNTNARSGKFGAVAKGKNATKRTLRTAVVGRGRPFNVTRWGGKEVKVNKRAVATQHAAYGRKQIAKRTWMLKNRAIVVRQGASFRGVFGPGVGQMMQRPRVVKAMQDEVFARFPGHFSSAFRFYVRRR